MKKILITLCDGSPAFKDILAASAPTHARYAALHDYDYMIASKECVLHHTAGEKRHPSWAKVMLLKNQPHEFKLFLDADVGVVRYDKDILEDFPAGKKFGMVVHHTSDGAVPNCGVLACMGDVEDEMFEIWDRDHFARSKWWWEQAGMISLLGGDPDAEKISVPPGPLWGELPYEWNPHICDSRGFCQGIRFFHATQLADRAGAIRAVCGT